LIDAVEVLRIVRVTLIAVDEESAPGCLLTCPSARARSASVTKCSVGVLSAAGVVVDVGDAGGVSNVSDVGDVSGVGVIGDVGVSRTIGAVPAVLTPTVPDCGVGGLKLVLPQADSRNSRERTIQNRLLRLRYINALSLSTLLHVIFPIIIALPTKCKRIVPGTPVRSLTYNVL